MNKEFLGIRIKAWLITLAIFVLVGGIVFGIIISPHIFGVIAMAVIIILVLYLLAFVLDSEMD
jgi:hypothetical protein